MWTGSCRPGRLPEASPNPPSRFPSRAPALSRLLAAAAQIAKQFIRCGLQPQGWFLEVRFSVKSLRSCVSVPMWELNLAERGELRLTRLRVTNMLPFPL